MNISVVIPTHNRASTLPRAIESVLEQRSPVDEIIVVDDGSSDETGALLATRYPELSVIEQENLGVSAARNRGIAEARGDWIALLDSDDCWLPQKIERISACHEKHPDFVLYHSDEIWIRNGVRVNPMRKHRKHGGWIFNHCLPLCAISPSAAVISKTVLTELGGFDETLSACEDYDLWLRLCSRYPVAYVDEALIVKHGGHADQLSRRYPIMDRFRVRALDRLLSSAPLTSAAKAAALQTLATKLDILQKGARRHANQEVFDECRQLRWRWFGEETQASC